jgi:PKD repeat protein
MKKTIRYSLIVLIALMTRYGGLMAQDIVWRDTFRNGVPATAAQITKWNNFRAKLVSTNTYLGMKISGTNNTTGLSHSDATIAKDYATALRTLATYTSPSVGGNVWTLCNRYQGEVWINPPATCSGSNCPNPGYIIRPGIGTANSNWGGINTATCGGSDQWMELRFIVLPPYLKDAGTLAIGTPDKCAYTQPIKARFKNFGKTAIDSFQYYYSVNGTTTGPVWRKIRLASGVDTLLTVAGSYTYTANTNYTIRVWTDKPDNKLDSFRRNDTAVFAFKFAGSKPTPNGIDTTVCGSQSLVLRSIPVNASDSIVWYSDRALTKNVGRGRTYKTPYLASGTTYKYYVSSFSDFERAMLTTGLNAPAYGYPSSMFDIRTTGGDITVDSLGINIYDVNFSAGTSLDVEVWLRKGSWSDPGATSTQSMWTKVYTGPVISAGSSKRSTLKASFTLQGGQQYAVYVNPTVTGSNTILAKLGSFTYQNSDIIMSGGTLNQINFGAFFSGYTIETEVFYKKYLCVSAPDSVLLKINPAPFGAKLSAGTPFQTAPKKSGIGSLGSPHVVALGDTLAFNLLPPTGYVNTGHNTAWKVKNVTMKSLKGRVLKTFTWADPVASSGAAGRLVYTPDKIDIDSQFIAEVSIQDLGPYNCDTLLKHYVYVAPLPEPSFTRSKVTCEGDAVEFVNKSKILTGFIDHKWYFGDGDSSEAVDPIHFYPKGGVYYLTYKAISSIYGYERIKRDTITVSPLPNVNFRILNVCEGKTHQFINTSTGLGTLTYKWNFGVTPGTNATSKDATFKYSKPGQYNVTLTVEDNGCPATRTKTAYLFHTPVSDFTYPSDPGLKFCSNVPVQFTNKSTLVSGILGQSWSFGDGEVGTVKNPMHQFKNGGSYNVRLISISEFGCADTTTKKIDIGSAPVVTWTNGQVCDQTPTQFTNGTAPISGFASAPKWSFGDGSTSTSDNPSHQFTTLGPKTVKLVVSVNNGCSDSMTKTLNVGTQAIADFSVQNTCSGKPVQFDNKSSVRQGNMVYEWDFGDGSPISNVSDPVHTYNTTNSFSPNVKLKVVVDGACETVVTKPLQVFELPNCTFTVTDDWTPGDGYRTIKVQAANTTYPFYRYKFSDGGSLNTSGGVYQFPYEGDFDITLYTRNQADCECSKTIVKSVRNSMGTTGLGEGNIRLYPNPSNGLVNVESGSRIQKIAVYNVLGESVEAGVELKGNKAELRMQGLSEGVYLVKITTEQGVITRSVSINR